MNEPMKFRRLDVGGYGLLMETGITDLPDGLILIEGENGAGKSTFFDFIRTLLFGARTNAAKVPALRGGRHGGSAEVSIADRRYRVERDLSVKSPVSGIVRAERLDSGEDVPLEALLGSVTDGLFRNVFSIDLSLLSNPSVDHGLEEEIQNALTGTSGRQGLPKAIKTLDGQIGEIFTKQGRDQAIPRLRNELKSVEEELAAAKRSVEAYDARKVEAAEAEAALERLEAEVAALTPQATRLQALLGIWDSHVRLQELEQAPDEDRILAHTPAIEELLQGLQRLREAQARLGELKAKVEQTRSDADRSLARLGEGWSAERLERSPMTFPLHQEAKARSEAIEKVCTRIEQLRTTWDATNGRGEQAMEDLQAARAAFHATFPDPPSRATFEARREALNRLDGLRLDRREAREERERSQRELEEAQRLRPPYRPLGLLALLAWTLMTLLAAGFGEVLGLVVGAVTGGVVAAAVIWWIRTDGHRVVESHLEVYRAAVAEATRREESLARRVAEIADANGWSVDSNEQLGEARTALDSEEDALEQFEEAQKELEAHEQKARGVAREAESLESDLAKFEAKEAELRREWREWLQSVHLPADLRPEAFTEFCAGLEDARGKRREADAAGEELVAAETTVEQAHRDLNRVLEALGREPVNGDRLPERILDLHGEMQRAHTQRTSREMLAHALLSQAGSPERAEEMRSALGAFESKAELEATVDEAADRLSAKVGERDEARQRLSALEGEIRALEHGRGTQELLARREEVVAAIQEHAQEWAELTLARMLLHRARDYFSLAHQGPILESATDALRSLTGDPLVRIAAGVDKEGFLVHDGVSRRRHQELNRSLRERLVLALRLGYIEFYSRHHQAMPVVMDDVMVNFDGRHQTLAAKALLEFAEHHQVLYLTCHDWTCDIFAEAAAETGRSFAHWKLQDWRFSRAPAPVA